MSFITNIKNKVLGIKDKVNNLSNEIKSLETSVSNLEEPQSFQIVEGLTVKDAGNSITYRMEGDTYQYLLEIWKRNIVPVIKVKYLEGINVSYLYLPCTKQRYRDSGARKEVFITDNFINISSYEAKLIFDANHNVYYITGNRYVKRTVINDSESDCYDDDSSSN